MWQIISGYISVCIMMVGVYIFGRIVLERKIDLNKSFKDIFNILIFSILQTLIFLNLEGTDKSIIMAIINMIFCKNVFKINIQHAIYLTILYMVILLIPDLIEIFFITEILNLSVDFCFNSYSGSIISNASACILFIIITMLLKKYLVKIM